MTSGRIVRSRILAAALLSAYLLGPGAAQANSAAKPMITQNPDGTFTIQKNPRDGNSKDSRIKQGLVIPSQVVVPIIPVPERKPKPPPQQTGP